jgi:hypothetical protein
MPASKEQTIFISHSSLNKNVTEELYQVLTDRIHLNCWLDNFDLQTEGGSFSSQIVNALRSSSLLVLVNSPAARASDYVQREIQAAKDLQMPIQRCSISEAQAPLFRNLKILWLVLNIQFRLSRSFIIAAITLFVLLAALAVSIFLLGTRVVPVLARAGRDLPKAFRSTPTATAIPTPSDPKIVAPFHFKPDTVILQDDFNSPGYENSFSDPTLSNIIPRDPQAKVSQQKGSLVVSFPIECLSEEKRWDCMLVLNSRVLDTGAIQYFGFRARTEERTSLRGISVSLSINDHKSSLAGFGWNFTDYAMAFFRSIPSLPEKELYAYVSIDTGWHAYEILRDSQKNAYDYYIDGQLVEEYSPIHASEWGQAPLRLIIFSLKGYFESGGQQSETQFKLDEFIIGRFNNR